VQNCILLILVKTFKVVWLNSVRSKHWLFGGWVFRHKIVVHSECNFFCGSLLSSFETFDVTIALFTSHCVVC